MASRIAQLQAMFEAKAAADSSVPKSPARPSTGKAKAGGSAPGVTAPIGDRAGRIAGAASTRTPSAGLSGVSSASTKKGTKKDKDKAGKKKDKKKKDKKKDKKKKDKKKDKKKMKEAKGTEAKAKASAADEEAAREARKAARRARAARRKAERDAVAAGRNVADDPFERSAVVMMGDEANSIDPVEAAAAAEAEAEAARIKAAEETEARAARKAARKARVAERKAKLEAEKRAAAEKQAAAVEEARRAAAALEAEAQRVREEKIRADREMADARRRQAEEKAKREAEEAAAERRQAEIDRAAAEARAKAERDARRAREKREADEAAKRAEDARRKAEERAAAAEAERLRAEAEREAERARRQAEMEAKIKALEERNRVEAQRRAEEQRLRKEREAKARAEREAARERELEARRAEAQRKRAEEEAKARAAEEARLARLEAERLERQAAEDARREAEAQAQREAAEVARRERLEREEAERLSQQREAEKRRAAEAEAARVERERARAAAAEAERAAEAARQAKIEADRADRERQLAAQREREANARREAASELQEAAAVRARLRPVKMAKPRRQRPTSMAVTPTTTAAALSSRPALVTDKEGAMDEREKVMAKVRVRPVSLAGYDTGVREAIPQLRSRKVQTTERLYHVKGKRRIKTVRAPLAWQALCGDSVFVLDCSRTIYIWFGADASRMEGAKGVEVATRIREKERNMRAKIEHLHQGVEDAAPIAVNFWSALGGPVPAGEAVAPAGSMDREEFVTWLEARTKFYRVSADGSQLEEAAAGSKISYTMLVDDAVFVLDAWFEVYTWVGRSSEVALRKRGVALARELLEASGADRPQWVKDNGVERVMQNTERTVFREKFRGWPGGIVIAAKPTYKPDKVKQQKLENDAAFRRQIDDENRRIRELQAKIDEEERQREAALENEAAASGKSKLEALRSKLNLDFSRGGPNRPPPGVGRRRPESVAYGSSNGGSSGPGLGRPMSMYGGVSVLPPGALGGRRTGSAATTSTVGSSNEAGKLRHLTLSRPQGPARSRPRRRQRDDVAQARANTAAASASKARPGAAPAAVKTRASRSRTSDQPAKTGKDALLEWCQRETEGYQGVEITGFNKNSWIDGLGFAALIHRFRPSKLDFATAAALSTEDRLAMVHRVGEDIGITQFIDPEDYAFADRKVLTLQLSQYFQGLRYTGWM